jgi:glycine hydroxymethyltransferase
MRFGSPAVTTRGFKEPEMREVASLIAQVLDHISSDEAMADVRRKVGELTGRFPLYPWKLSGRQAK